MHFNEQFIKKTIPDLIISGQLPALLRFAVDTRVLTPGDIFIALAGEHADGHAFIADAVARGAAGAMVAADKKELYESFLKDRKLAFIIVQDPFHALITLAATWRKNFSYPVIGVTGSVGKTSTKEQLALLLKMAGKNVIVSQRNQNTLIGAALNILRMTDEHDAAVFEMGISKRNEMAPIAQLVHPTIGVITKIGHSHMAGVGSLHDIAQQKKAIFSYFSNENVGIINGDQDLLAHSSFMHPVIKFGNKTTNHIQARKVRFSNNAVSFTLKIYKDKYPVVIPKAHEGAVATALIVAAVGHLLQLDRAVIIDAIQKPVTVAGRFEKKVFKNGRGIIINDCYNANPESMKAALLAFERLSVPGQKIAILGDMLELGSKSSFWHRQIGRFLNRISSVKKVILVGNMVEWIEKMLPEGMQAIRVATWQEASLRLPELIANQESAVLVKGSQGMGLLNLVKEHAQ